VVYLRRLAGEMRGMCASAQHRPPVPPGAGSGAERGPTGLPGHKLA
jgi:hypothetical protein